MRDGKMVYGGKVGQEINLVQAAEAAQLCTLNALANAKAALGSLDAVVRVVMVNGFVNGIDGFSDSPKVLNGASEFLLKVFGDAGKHARAAVSVNGLPLGAAVEVQIVLEVR
jgi:enamine deaminase RidA (YjgF/YER057c/UK114 family)